MEYIKITEDEFETICKCADEFDKLFSYADSNEDNFIAIMEIGAVKPFKEMADITPYRKLIKELIDFKNKTRRLFKGDDK